MAHNNPQPDSQKKVNDPASKDQQNNKTKD